MKLIHTGYGLELEIKENQITVLSVENPKAYTTILRDIWSQVQGGEGSFLFSDGEKVKSIAKEMECIYNPFELDCNDKKIIAKLYQEIREQAEEELVYEGVTLNTKVLEYLEQLLQRVPYPLDYNVDFDVTNLLKLYGVKIESAGGDLLEKIVDYLKVLSQICGVRNYVFIGIKQYLETEELEQLYEFAFYEKINIIIIEAIHSLRVLGEKCWLLDKDLCIIDLW